MISRSILGSHSLPPYPHSSFYFEFEGPSPDALLAPLQLPPSHPTPPPKTMEYFIEGDEPEIASNALILVDAQTQYSRPPSRPGSAAASPRPVIGICLSGVVEALITAAVPVYAPRSPRASPPPPPPPAYADSAARFVRRPPQALLVSRPRTRSHAGDGPLLEPLISDNRCFLYLD